ncbi:hypothetical protein VKT23_018669 [Stygiomarasmius scandens]|uniref:Uncharacterized protein n=1 Tax=Marasmiellus scandens TaxID=2682957 RepID=A0ABR1IQG8_9AGAR
MSNFQFVQLDPSTPIPGQPVTAKWKGTSTLPPSLQFEILQGSLTVASPVDFSPAQVDQENQEFVFTAPASAGTFDLVIFENDDHEPITFSTTLVVSAAPSSSTQVSSIPHASPTVSFSHSGLSHPSGSILSEQPRSDTTSPRVSETLHTADTTPSNSSISGSTTSTTGSDSTSSKKENEVIILGSVLGVVIFLVILGLVLFWIRRTRRRKQNHPRPAYPGPETTTNPDQRSAEPERESPAMQGTLSPLTVIRITDNAKTIERKKRAIVPHRRESTIGMQVQDAQQSDPLAHDREDIRFEEESIDRPPSYTSR